MALNRAVQVLLVDNQPSFRRDLIVAIQASLLHLNVREAESAETALAMLGEDNADILITDVTLPGITGIELVMRLRLCGNLLPAVLINMEDDAKIRCIGGLIGAPNVITKAAAFHTIPTILQQILTNSPAASQQLEHDAEQSPLALLSSRERQVLQLVVEGKSSLDIANLLHLPTKTVDTYRSWLMQKLEVGDVPSLVRLALRLGILSQ
jgi:DNA-binding NarL/FixJ family response regulator